MTDTVYIHFGHTEFQPDLIKPLDYSDSKSAIGSHVKPPYCSGLWGSPVDSDISWKAWNAGSGFRECDDINSFRFRIRDGFKILKVDSTKSAIHLIEKYLSVSGTLRLYFKRDGVHYDSEQDLRNAKDDCIDYMMCTEPAFCDIPSFAGLDFIKMQSDGYSGMEISITDCPKLYYLLYGWDCDSIVIWNPEAVVQL